MVGLNGANYRLLKSPLEKDVEVEKCKFIVKPDRVTIKLRKVKGQYSYDNWNDLVPKYFLTEKCPSSSPLAHSSEKSLYSQRHNITLEKKKRGI